MKLFQWLLANQDALLAIVAELETIFGGSSPTPAPQTIDLSGIQAFIAAVEKWLPVIEAIVAQFAAN